MHRMRARVARFDRTLNAICAEAPDDTISSGYSSRDELRGPLGGVPYAVKDQFFLPWREPQDGTPVVTAPRTTREAAVCTRLAAAGAMPAFVTNMHQLGMGITGDLSAYGRCANPWDPRRFPGGSSSGSAVAVAAGYVPFSIGTDAAGSVRLPAAWCGITGLKPTWGAVPTRGYTSASSSMASIGTFTRSAEECRTVSEVILARRLRRQSSRAPRIGIITGEAWENVSDDVRANFDQAVNLLRGRGHQITDVSIAEAGLIPLATIISTGVDRLANTTPEWMQRVFPVLEPQMKALLKARYQTAGDLVQRVMTLRTILRRELAELFTVADVLLCPTVPAVAPDSEQGRLELPSGNVAPDLPSLQLTGLANLTGVPALSTPMGPGQHGLPTGLMMHARWGSEDVLLDLAQEFEEASDGCFLVPERLVDDNESIGVE